MTTENQSSTPAPAAANSEPTPEQEMATFTTEAYHDGVKVEKKESAKEPAKADKEADSEDDKDDESEAETPEESAKSDDKEDADEADKEADKKKGLSAKQRVQQAIARQRTAEAARDVDRGEVARLRAENEALRRGEKKDLTPAKEGAKGDDKPKPDDYKFGSFDEAYQVDLADFNAKKAFAKLEADRESTRQQEAEVAEAAKFKADMDGAMERGAEKYDDFVEKVVDGAATEEWKLTKTVAHLSVKSDVGHEILYHLASNPKESEKVAKMSQVDQAVWFGRQETRFTAPPKAEKKLDQQPPKVPPPPSNRPRGSNGKFAVNADTNDFAAFEAKMKSEGEFS